MISLRNKKVAVLGLLDPGIAAIGFACRKGAKVFGYGVATDQDVERMNELLKGLSFEINTEDIPVGALEGFDLVIQTPGGGRRYQLQVERAKEKGVSVYTDLELAMQLYRAPIVAITGTNGKSTVVHLLRSVIEKAGKTAIVAGGDYTDFLDSVQTKEPYDLVVLELNSSRLMRVGHIKPHIAVLLNIYGGHAERHRTFKEYAEAKGKVFTDIGPDDYFIFSAASKPINKLLQEKGCQGKLFPLFLGPSPDVGGHLNVQDQEMVFQSASGEKSHFSYRSFPIAGTHNVENALATMCIAKLCGLPDSAIQWMLQSAPLLADRMELVKKIDGVPYYNDAKSVNATALYSSLHGFEDQSVFLIAGGTFSPLHEKDRYLPEMIQKKVACLVLFGTDRRRFYKLWGKEIEAYVVPAIKDAVELVSRKVEKGKVVLFSPGARAELHVHGSTQKRGEEFRRLVGEVAKIAKAMRGLRHKV